MTITTFERNPKSRNQSKICGIVPFCGETKFVGGLCVLRGTADRNFFFDKSDRIDVKKWFNARRWLLHFGKA